MNRLIAELCFESLNNFMCHFLCQRLEDWMEFTDIESPFIVLTGCGTVSSEPAVSCLSWPSPDCSLALKATVCSFSTVR